MKREVVGYCDEVVVWLPVEVLVILVKRSPNTVVWESKVWMVQKA